MRVTWSEGAVPPRFGYFVEGQSNAVGRPLGEPRGSGFALFMFTGVQG